MQHMPDIVRKGPHKSVHCHFYKPPYSSSEDKPRKSSYETKTKFNFSTQTAQLKVTDIYDEPGEPMADSATCVCVLVSDPPPCPKCAPDKNRPPPKKRSCKCPLGAIPLEQPPKSSRKMH